MAGGSAEQRLKSSLKQKGVPRGPMPEDRKKKIAKSVKETLAKKKQGGS